MRESGAKVVTLMIEVLKIIWKFEWKWTIINDINWEKLIWIDSLILPTISLQFNYILGERKSSQNNELALYTIPDT